MIEKLKRPVKIGGTTFREKINEIIDAVNELQKQIDKVSCAILDLATPDGENKALKSIQDHRPNMVMDDPFGPHSNIYEQGRPADPYAEQRKWIGKLCKFWFADAENPTFGILDFVDAGPHPEPFHINCGESEQGWFPHCEPVKPDDDIIYKGGDND